MMGGKDLEEFVLELVLCKKKQRESLKCLEKTLEIDLHLGSLVPALGFPVLTKGFLNPRRAFFKLTTHTLKMLVSKFKVARV